MTTFEYKAYDTAGRSSTGLIEAADLKDARRRLAARGLLPESLAAAGGAAVARGVRGAVFSAGSRICSPARRSAGFTQTTEVLSGSCSVDPSVSISS